MIIVLSSSATVSNSNTSKGEQEKPDVYKMDSREVNPYLCGALDEATSFPCNFEFTRY